MMGISLVNQALFYAAPKISDRAFRVLMRMAATALDKPSDGQPAATFFGGVEMLTMVLRSGRAEKDDSAPRIVRYAVAELIEAGLIECVEKPRKGHRPVYRLTLDSGMTVPLSRNNGSGMTPDSGTKTTDSGTLHSSLGTTGSTQDDERLEDEVVASPAVVQTAREDDPTDDLDFSAGVKPTRFAVGDCDHYLEPDGTCFTCSGARPLRSVS